MKAAEATKIFAPCMGTMPSERARQENGFLILRRIVLTLGRLSGRPSGFEKSFKHINPQ